MSGRNSRHGLPLVVAVCLGGALPVLATPSPCARGPGVVPGDIVYPGQELRAALGQAIALAGDLDGDGSSDLIAGEPGATRAAPDQGAAWILFGSEGASGLLPLPGTPPAARISTGEGGAALGSSVAGIGDFDGDGFLDVAVGLPGARGYVNGDADDGVAFTGAVQIVYGAASWPVVIDIDALPATRIVGAFGGEAAGSSVAGIGDVNGDGLPDILIGSPRGDVGALSQAGRASVVYGRSGRPAVIDLETEADVVIDGHEPFGRLGWTVAAAGDVDGDGSPDLAVSAPFADPAGFNDSGEVFILRGSTTLPARIDSAALVPGAGFHVAVDRRGGRAGWSLSSGDFDGDGLSDVVIGAPFSGSSVDYHSSLQRGIVYLLFGASDLPAEITSIELPVLSTLIEGARTGWQTGYAVAGAGDFNRDGLDDLAVSAPRATISALVESGAVYVLNGRAVWPARIDLAVPAEAGTIFAGGRERARFGEALASAGDHDALGGEDLAVGVPRQSPADIACSGQVSVFLGDAVPAPSALTCATAGNDVVLSWTNGFLYTDVAVFRDGVLITALAGPQTTYTDVDVPVGPHVWAIRGLVGRARSRAVACEIRVDVVPPTDLACAAVRGDVELSWTLPMTYTAVRVERDGALVAQIAGGATAYTDLAVAPGVHAWAVKGVAPGPVGDEESLPVLCDVAVPDVPTALACEAIGSDVALTWTEPTPVDRAEVIRDDVVIVVLPGGTGSFVDSGVAPGPHTYGVRGVLGTGSGRSALCEVLVVAPPAALACSVAGDRALLTWSVSATYDAIRVRLDGVEQAALPGDATSHEIAGLAPGGHSIEVIAVIGTTPSDPVACLVTALAAPASLTCAAEADLVSLSWDPVPDAEEIVVLLDDAEVARLPGTAAAHELSAVAAGAHVLAVRAERAGSVGPSTTCELTVLEAPAGLECAGEAGEITLTWDPVPGALELLLGRDGAPLATLSGEAVEYLDSGVAEGVHTYDLRARAGSSRSAATTCELVQPGAPSGLLCQSFGLRVTVSWTPGDSYGSVNILRDGVLLATLPGDATELVDEVVAADETHEYRVSGTIGAGTSRSAICSISLPGVPTGMSCSALGSRVDLEWTLPADVESAIVYRAGERVAEVFAPQAAFSETVSEPGVYLYEVRARRGAAIGEPAGCETVVLAPPTDLACRAAGGRAILSWVSTPEAETIIVFRGGEQLAIIDGAAETYEDDLPGPGDYLYALTALVGSSRSDAVTCSLHAPSPPPALHCLVDDQGIVLSWESPEPYDVALVRRNDVELTEVDGSLSTWRDPDVEPGVEYSYEVSGRVGESTSTSAACRVRIPPSPVDLVCQVSGDVVSLGWDDPETYDEVRVLRNGEVVIGTLAGDAIEFEDGPLDPGSYGYEVRGVTAGVVGPPAKCSVIVVASPADFLCVADPAAGEVRLTWGSPGAYDALRVERSGVVLAEALDGSATLFVDALPGPGDWKYQVFGIVGTTASVPAECTVGILAAPQGVACESREDGVWITWTGDPAWQSVQLLRDGAPIAALDGGEERYLDTGLEPGSYVYRLFGQGAAGEVSVASQPCEVLVIPPPTGLVCTVELLPAAGRVSLEWAPAAAYDAIRVERAEGEEVTELAALGGGETAWVDEPVPEGAFTYRVVATVGESSSAVATCDVEVVLPKLIRGDANADREVDIADAVTILMYLFRGGRPPACLDAADGDDSGEIEISDPIYILNWRFNGGPEPPAPFREPGIDSTPDSILWMGDLGCAESL